MPTSHRAPGRSIRPGRGPLVALIVVVVAAIAVLIWWRSDSGGSPAASVTTPTPSITWTPIPTPTAKASATHGPTSSPSTPSTPHSRSLPRVPAAPPHHLSIGSAVAADFGSSITPTSGRLIPSSVDVLQRLGTRGTPGSPGNDTVVLVGAATTAGTGVLDDLGRVHTGDTITVQTPTGTLRYTVSTIGTHAAGAVLGLPAVRQHHRGRLVIDCAHYSGGNRVGPDLVVVAQLSGAESVRP